MYKVRFYCIDGAHYEYLEQETVDENVTCSTHPESEIRDFVIIEDENDIKDAIAKKHIQNTDEALRVDKVTVDADGRVHIDTSLAEALRIGNGATGIDYKIKFSGNNGDGEIIWQEAKDKFKFDCGLDVTGCGFIDTINEYTLDATGTTGPTGPQGIQGITGPTGPIADVTYAEDETVSATTDTAWQEKYSMEFTPPSIGNYLLEWSLETANSKVGSATLVQVELDDTTQINRVYHEANMADEYSNSSGFKRLNFADTNLHTIDVDFKADGDTAMICRVRLSMRKI